jgi:hypothetical protein
MKKIIIFPFITIWALGLIMFVYAAYGVIIEIAASRLNVFRFVFFGFAAYLVSVIFVKPQKYEIWNTITHELAHAFFVLFTFAKFNGFHVKGGTGFVQYSYKKSTIMGLIRAHLVSLAPYFFPYATLILCLLFLIVKPEKGIFITELLTGSTTIDSLFFFIGFTYAYHLTVSFIQARPYQTDFSKGVGFIYGIVFILCMQAFFFLVMLLILTFDYNAIQVIKDYFNDFVELISHYFYKLI